MRIKNPLKLISHLYDNTKLSVKISIVVNVLIILSLAFLSTILIITQRNKVSTDLTDRAALFAEFTAPSFYQTFLNNRFATQVQPVLDAAVTKNKDITEVDLLGRDGTAQFIYKPNTQNVYQQRPGTKLNNVTLLQDLQNTTTVQHNEIINGVNYYVIVVPLIEDSGAHIFSMRYVASFDAIQESIRQIYLSTLFSIGPIMFLVTAFTFFFSIRITRPLTLLTNTTKQITAGNFNAVIDIQSSDEIGLLAKAFNQMASNLKKYKEDIERYNKNLEQEVSDRTKELADKISELERFNKLTIDRELRIIDLKKEVQELKTKYNVKDVVKNELEMSNDFNKHT